MSDLESSPSTEAGLSTEQETISDFKTVAKKLGDYTSTMLIEAKDVGRRFLEKTWYSHQASLFYLEGIILKTIRLVVPEAKLAGSVGKTLTKLGTIALSENLIKALTHGQIKVGDHMTVGVRSFRGFTPKELSDGSILRPGWKVGIIDFSRDMPKLGKDENLITFTKQLFRSGEQSLKELAELCKNNDPRLRNVGFFWGISRLAGPLAERLGFDIFEIANPIIKLEGKILGWEIVHATARENKQWQMFKENFRSPREAIISRERLVELYVSSNAVSET